MSDLLTGDDREQKLDPLLKSGWAVVAERDAIEKRFEFVNFVHAFGWMTKVALWAESLNHHPEWSNVYKHVHVILTTHDVGGLSAKDIELAQKMDQLTG